MFFFLGESRMRYKLCQMVEQQDPEKEYINFVKIVRKENLTLSLPLFFHFQFLSLLGTDNLICTALIFLLRCLLKEITDQKVPLEKRIKDGRETRCSLQTRYFPNGFHPFSSPRCSLQTKEGNIWSKAIITCMV